MMFHISDLLFLFIKVQEYHAYCSQLVAASKMSKLSKLLNVSSEENKRHLLHCNFRELSQYNRS